MKIKVGYCDIEVRPLSPILSDADSAEGLYNGDTGSIYVRSDRRPDVQAAILIHELLHACFDVFGIPRSDLTEETVVSRLEIALATVFRDNPAIFGVIHQALCNGKPVVKA